MPFFTAKSQNLHAMKRKRVSRGSWSYPTMEKFVDQHRIQIIEFDGACYGHKLSELVFCCLKGIQFHVWCHACSDHDFVQNQRMGNSNMTTQTERKLDRNSFPLKYSWPVSGVCRNWCNEPLAQCFPGCVIRKLSACIRFPHKVPTVWGKPETISKTSHWPRQCYPRKTSWSYHMWFI